MDDIDDPSARYGKTHIVEVKVVEEEKWDSENGMVENSKKKSYKIYRHQLEAFAPGFSRLFDAPGVCGVKLDSVSIDAFEVVLIWLDHRCRFDRTNEKFYKE